jgi:hypothetical protein
MPTGRCPDAGARLLPRDGGEHTPAIHDEEIVSRIDLVKRLAPGQLS